MKVLGFIVNVICSLIIGGILSVSYGPMAFAIGLFGSLVSYYILKGLAMLSTAPISYIVDSDMTRWGAQCFGPWLLNYAGWFFIGLMMAGSISS